MYGGYDVAGGFCRFLRGVRDADPENSLAAENFLLDENVRDARWKSYADSGCVRRHFDMGAWKNAHGGYLGACVRLNPEENERIPYASLDTSKDDVCPETFREPSVYHLLDPNLYLVRVAMVNPLQKAMAGAGIDDKPETLRDKIQAYLDGKSGAAGALELDDLLEAAWLHGDVRPVWACFWEDARHVLYERPEDAPPDWGNQLRDRLGLYHLQPARGTLPIVVFRYAAEDIPWVGKTRQPAAAKPCVLDDALGPVFCPAPREARDGHPVDLNGSGSGKPWREVLHASFPFKAEHLFRLGEVTTQPGDLANVRARHMQFLRTKYGRTGYGEL